LSKCHFYYSIDNFCWDNKQLYWKFKDRTYAANILAAALQDFLDKDKEYKEGNNNDNLTVLGIPRGGVIVADIVAAKLRFYFWYRYTTETKNTK
jgi:hypothetical protein